MKIKTSSVDEYISKLPNERAVAVTKIREVIAANLPEDFLETMNYGMIGYVVPHKLYPAGYHCDPKLPLPFINIASKKNFVAVYHMGIYANPALQEWFTSEYPKHVKSKLDGGKSCFRFKKMDQIPYELIGELATKMSAEEWVKLYQMKFVK